MGLAIKHHPGRHCASTALCNLANYQGLRWSEATCFGLGAGLGFWFINFPGASPSRFIHVRSADLEEQFFQRIGFSDAARKFSNPEEGERELCRILDRGFPVLVQTDIYYLPYFNSKTHFPGHVITAWGYDSREKCFYVSDTEREGLQEVPFAAMRKARYSSHGFFSSKGNMFAPRNIAYPSDLPAIIGRAILDNSRTLVNISDSTAGVVSLEQWLHELPDWGKFDDWQWTARFTYQVIEKRGTGGGGFRLLYKRFLEEASSYLPRVSDLKLPEMMADLAAAWTALSEALQKVSEEPVFNHEQIAPQLKQVQELELAYHSNALKLDLG